MASTGGVTGALTEGTGVSAITGSKILKDIVLDFLLSLPAVFVAINVASLDQALLVPTAVGIGVADALIRVLYRAAIRWAQSDSVA